MAVPGLPLSVGLFQMQAATDLGDNQRHLRALVLLVLLFACAWVTAWESQWFEPSGSYKYQGPSGNYLIGAQRAASWNLGRFVAGALAVTFGIAAASLLRSRRIQDMPQSRKALRATAVVTVAALVASVPLLIAKEDARRSEQGTLAPLSR